MRRVVAPFVLLALVLAGCGQSNPELIPQSNADALTATADKIRTACDAADRTVARREIRNAQREIDALPSTVDSKLRKNLEDWVQQIRDRITADCQGDEPADTPTPARPRRRPPRRPRPRRPPRPRHRRRPPPQAPTDTPTAAPTDDRRADRDRAARRAHHDRPTFP